MHHTYTLSRASRNDLSLNGVGSGLRVSRKGLYISLYVYIYTELPAIWVLGYIHIPIYMDVYATHLERGLREPQRPQPWRRRRWQRRWRYSS